MFPLAFVAGWLQGHWWGFISRNYVVWPTFLLMDVFIALKGSHFWFLFDFTAAGVVPCGGRKTSPCTSTISDFYDYSKMVWQPKEDGLCQISQLLKDSLSPDTPTQRAVQQEKLFQQFIRKPNVRLRIGILKHVGGSVRLLTSFEPRHEKTCLRGFRPGKTQTGLHS